MPDFITVRNLDQPNRNPTRVKVCDSFLARLRGLMFCARLHPDEGLLLVQKRDSRLDSSIHMLFVPFDLSVVWINSEMEVVSKVIARPWRPAYLPGKPARYILEIHPERWNEYQVGDRVKFINV